jgi:hypothetical protein
VHLLQALNQHGVLAGLVNFILRYIDNQEGNNNFEPVETKKIIKEIISKKDKHVDVHKQAKQLWNCALYSKNYIKPLEIAQSVINTSHRLNDATQYVQNGIINEIEWASDWSYNTNKPAKLKVKVLFARLIRSSYNEENKVIVMNSDFKQTLADAGDAVKIELDHMEPSNPDPHLPKEYYFINPLREKIINDLGNMMPLPKERNSSKSNAPMYTIFDELKIANLGIDTHWLTRKTFKLLEKKNYHNLVKDVKIPTEKFFIKRKEHIIKYFNQAISSPIYKNKKGDQTY